MILSPDCGEESLSKEFKRLLEEKAILHQISVPYCPEQSGAAELMGQTLVEKTRDMLKAAGLSNEFWAVAIANAAFLRNRSSPLHLLKILSHFKLGGTRNLK